jgi:hypothetical protein
MVARPMTLARATLAVCVALAVGSPAVAVAADPIMRLSELRPGMDCKSYSVVRGTEPVEFDVEILDVVEGDTATDGPRILVRAGGAAVDASGIGFGFSGSPIYCPDDQGTMKNAGAISESLGASDGKTVLATPIEAILGNPPEPPSSAAPAPANARSLSGPLTISGLTPRLGAALMKATANSARPLLASPARPLNPFPPTAPKPGGAISVGYSSGAVSIGGVGTVSYVDGDKVWAFGHPFDGVGRRSLLLQDAYVYGVIAGGSPEMGGGAYKLAAAGHDLGTFSNDAITAIVGRTGPLPATVPVTVLVTDLDTKATRTDVTRVADEATVGQPTGISPLSYVAPLAVSNAGSILKGSPARSSGTMCMRIVLAELPNGIRICNRYVFGGTAGPMAFGGLNLVSGLAASDVAEVMALVDGYRFGDLRVTALNARLELERGTRQAYMQKLSVPPRVRRGQRVTVKIGVRHVGGRRQTLTQELRIPRGARRGVHQLVLTGTDSDDGAGDMFGAFTTLIIGGEEEDSGGNPGPRSLKQLARAIRGVERWDGVRLKFDNQRRRGSKAFERDDLRLSGRVAAFTRIVR